MPFIDHSLQDLRFALRQLAKHRAFTATALLVLTLGIGGSLTIFGFVEAALIKPLPYHEPSRLVTAFGTRPDTAQSQTRGSASYLDFVDWRARTQAFESITAYDVRGSFTVSTTAGPERVSGLRVTSGFFRTLGVTPMLGRDFLPSEEGLSGSAAVILSYEAWQTRFGGQPNVLGQTVTLESPWLSAAEPHIVVGVLPKGFHFTMANHADLWATIRGGQACWNVRSCQSLEVIARLAPDVSNHTATANLTAVLQLLRKEHPQHHRDEAVGKLIPLRDVMLGTVQPILLMLLGGAGLLLVIACINVVSLLLARSESRTREIAVRQALGASRQRLMGQFATEALLLTAVAVTGGWLFASWAMPLLSSLLTADMISRMPYLQTVGLNARLLAFACGIGLVAGVVFALTPIARTSIARGTSRLSEGSRGSAGLYWRRFGAHLVAAELAVAIMLLVGAGLLGKSLYRLLHVDTGFTLQDLAIVSVTPFTTKGANTTTDASAPPPGALAQRVAQRVATLPGVESVGYADQLPLGPGFAPSSVFWVNGRAEIDQQKENWPVRRVSAAYFTTLGVRLLRGRYFTEEEVAAARQVIIINETAARRYFAGDDPIGRSIAFGGAASPAREVVGVIADITDTPPDTPAHPSAYVPFDQSTFALVVRAPMSGVAFASLLTGAIREVDPNALLGRVTTMAERIDRLPSTSLKRASAWLIGAFAMTAFILSIVGLGGVVAYSVGQRTREIGVRMALGASRESVYRLIMGDAARLVAVGTVLGMIGAITAARLMRHLLFDVEVWDPPTLIGAAAMLTGAALFASYLPARRAASVNPLDVLRSE
jgi:macrolide transport system ATP-binding/permease protein